jgi:hypothetical protein
LVAYIDPSQTPSRSVEMTLSDLRLDYPEPEVLAKMRLNEEPVS